MKKRTILILALVMGSCFISLLVMQVRYVEKVVDVRRQHFEECVSRATAAAARQLELKEGARYLVEGTAAQDSIEQARAAANASATAAHGDTIHITTASGGPFADDYFTRRDGGATDATGRSLRERMRWRYNYEKALLDEVVYTILYTASDRPLAERIDFRELDQTLKAELADNDIDLKYHFAVYTSNGRRVYQCPDYESEGEELTFRRTLFPNDPATKMGELRIHFPEWGDYITQSIRFLLPSIVFTIILLVTYILTMVLVFRQKKLSEVKNDFINNMTHEFKTPISTISLAAQMLGDESVAKSPRTLARLAATITDEAKRLRFQVEKVLQLSMYENQRANLHMGEVNVNELISGVVHTFTLKVEKNGGRIITHLRAGDPIILADDMHLTNVVFNLMDNAVKYRRPDAPPELTVTTWNEPRTLCISLQDNGIGIRKENLKRIFEKFYRVHTGNLHDVKGFGLGLAYVKKIITDHKGTVHAESEPGIGTKFIIRLPLLDE